MTKLAQEYVQNADSESIICLCGNRAELDGFTYATRDRIVGPTKAAYTILCYECGRLIDVLDGRVFATLALEADGHYPCEHNDLWPARPVPPGSIAEQRGATALPQWCQDCGRQWNADGSLIPDGVWQDCPTHGHVWSADASPHAHP